MVIFALIIAGLVLSALSVAFFSVWGLPVVLLSVLVIAGYLAVARKEGAPVVSMERAKPKEPTGMPRSAGGGAETANQRQGQV
ncbi:MAG: hypothetical protein AVDCRST_MAG30-89 [uncultured Solirubrobacteraceae bacterium]|uniref:Uncharacterized protein n=1 Tax=uncultured Solirubrobacteraceae bacterium TaxID=1162706 RepID=A0A6J4RGT6_9ACTN|nr:MAG: hypothetical protein AVDCRST_MAG30-89 [uncultured Solirubrobacteraceae bacterium]